MELTYEQKREFYEKGYVKIPGVIPKIRINKALQAINYSVGEGMNVEDMTIYRSQSYCPDIKNTPIISDLLNKTPALELAKSAVAVGGFHPVGGGQVALRFPSLQDPPGKPVPHLDGMYSPNNGVKKGTIQNFTMLAGVLLSDLPNENAGNFTVWPGSHHLYEEYFKEHGPESLLEGLPPVDLPEPVQVTGEAGDLILCHYLLGHGIAPNVSSNIRYATFFRLTHVNHDNKEIMTNMWEIYTPIQETADQMNMLVK